MKRLFVIMGIMLIASMAYPQMLTTHGSKGQTYFNIATDYTLTNTTARYWEIITPQDWPTAQVATVAMSGVTTHTAVALNLYGSVSDRAAWVAIGSTVTWCTTTHDTVVVISNTTENTYRFFKLVFTPTGSTTTTIKNMEFKQYFGIL